MEYTHLVHNLLQCILIVCAALLWKTESAKDPCAENGKTLHRLGKTRFYILHDPSNRNFKFNFKEGIKKCKAQGMRLARIDKITTDAMVSRLLEGLLKKFKWNDTWYWIDAQYNSKLSTYTHNGENTPLKYTNFFYRKPRPMGVGGHVDWQNKYNKKKSTDQCIAITMPYPYPTDSYGFGTSWDERYCGSGDKRRVLCESLNPKCDYETEDAEMFVDSDVVEEYFTEGNFILSDRRFIVNWKPRTFEESEAYCQSLGLELHISQSGDECLLSYLKLWAQPITMYQFWTPLKYVPGSGIYTKDGKRFKMDDIEWIQGRSTRLDAKFCVAAVYSNEYSNQSACEGKCHWQSYTLTPANCLNPIGTICRHEDFYRRDCLWKAAYTDDNMKAVEDTAVTSFGNDYEQAWRSTYKQTFGNRVCGRDDRKMITTQWELPSSFYVTYEYDFLETYWIVDENGFKNEGNPNEFCTVANFEKRYGSYRMTTKKVPCTEWHFYLCQEKDG